MPNMNGDLSLISLNGHLYSLFSCFVITFSFCSKTQQKYKFVVLLQIKLPFKALNSIFVCSNTTDLDFYRLFEQKVKVVAQQEDEEY